MLTRLIRYLLRSIAALSALAVGGVIVAPAFAEPIHAAAYKRPVKPAVVKDYTIVQSALALENTHTARTDAEDLYLAKHPATSPIEIPGTLGTAPSKAPVQDGGAAPIVTPPQTPVKDAPITKPVPVVKKPIKTVKDTVKAIAKPVVNVSKLAAVLAFARAQIGEAYVMGGAGPNVWDCSGLTMKAFAAVGIDIGGHGVNVQYQKAKAKGYLVPWSQRKAGDLVFYGTPGNFSHVAIYSGGGKIIEAANPARPVIERPYWGTPYGQVARFLR